jgi:metal-responsive CopG/Arc/MetJ family transcriptional regulator
LTRRALVSLPDGVWNVLDKDLKGQIGDGDSEVIRNLVISYLTEKGYLLKGNKQNKQIVSEIVNHDNMITALGELLEEHGQLKHKDWENRIQSKLHK